MPRRIRQFQTSGEARDAFLQDVSQHRNNISKAFKLYGTRLCKVVGADYGKVEQRVAMHDLSKCNEKVELIGILAYYYRFEAEDLPIDSPRRRYLYEKGILNHYHMNSNHPEYWIRVNEGQFEALEMDNESIVECILDWIAMGYDNEFSSVDNYWYKFKGYRLIHSKSAEKLERLVKEYVKMRDTEGII